MIWDWDYDGWVILIAALAAVACALPGTFLMLRGMSMMGDAISHAVLPGIALGYLISETRDSGWIFAGAMVAGVVVAACSQGLHRIGRVERGAAMGVVFTAMFAGGLILIVQAANHVELDPHCVLEGAIEWAPLDVQSYLGGSVILPRAIPPLVLILIINTIVIFTCFKELKISSFDPEMARSSGLSTGFIDQLLMVMTAATCVACFEVVGSILVVALLVVPPAVARLFSDRLANVLFLSAGVGILMAVLGHLAAIRVPGWFTSRIDDVSTSGMIAVTGGVLFLAAWIGSPRHGLLQQTLRRSRLRVEIATEDALGILFRCEEQGQALGPRDLRRALVSYAQAHPLEAWWVTRTLNRKGLARLAEEAWTLSASGRERASRVIRTHRLWENWLWHHLNLPADHVHDSAMRLEHVTDDLMHRQLVEETEGDETDPHGRSIPPAMDSGRPGETTEPPD